MPHSNGSNGYFVQFLLGEVYAIQQYSSDRCPDLCQEITDNLEDWKDWVKASAEGNSFGDLGRRIFRCTFKDSRWDKDGILKNGCVGKKAQKQGVFG